MDEERQREAERETERRHGLALRVKYYMRLLAFRLAGAKRGLVSEAVSWYAGLGSTARAGTTSFAWMLCSELPPFQAFGNYTAKNNPRLVASHNAAVLLWDLNLQAQHLSHA